MALAKRAVFDPNDDKYYVAYAYDDYGRLAVVTYPDVTDSNMVYTRDGFGNKIQVTDNRANADNIGGDHTISYDYDPLGRVVEVVDQDGYTISYTYRADRQRQAIEVTDDQDSQIYAVYYFYDQAGRLYFVREKDPASTVNEVAIFSYDQNGNRSRLLYPLVGSQDGPRVWLDYSYNSENQLIGFDADYASTSVEPTYSLKDVLLDGLGRLIDANEVRTKTDSSEIAHNLHYQYDRRSQLTAAQITNINSAIWSAQYIYRRDGNLHSRTVNSTATTFEYDADGDDEDDSDLMTGATGGLDAEIGWDLNGNMVTLPLPEPNSVSWNWDNRLRSAQVGGTTITVHYDPAGNRIYKSVDDGSETERKYIVDTTADLPVILAEIDPSDDSIKKTYIWTRNEILAQHNGDQTTPRDSYLHDRLGSVRLILDPNASVLNRYTYNPYGERLTAETEETVSNPFQFAGEFYDETLEEYHNRARQYVAVLGIFTARDPHLGLLKEPLTLHVYLYCANDPINRTDPTGQLSLLELLSVRGITAKMNAAAASVGSAVMASARWLVNNAIAVRNFLTNLASSSPKGLDLAMKLGRAGEQHAGKALQLAKNTQRFFTQLGNYRIPDFVNGNNFFEVKNVAQLAMTGQIRDLMEIASAHGGALTLIIRMGTKLTGPLQQAYNSGAIDIVRMPMQ